MCSLVWKRAYLHELLEYPRIVLQGISSHAEPPVTFQPKVNAGNLKTCQASSPGGKTCAQQTGLAKNTAPISQSFQAI